MSAIVVNETAGTVTKVKNLGWLLRHRRDGIACVNVVILGHGKAGLEVTFESGVYYTCDFNDLGVCLGWIASHLLKRGWVAPENVDLSTLRLLRQYAGTEDPEAVNERSWGEQYVGRN